MQGSYRWKMTARENVFFNEITGSPVSFVIGIWTYYRLKSSSTIREGKANNVRKMDNNMLPPTQISSFSDFLLQRSLPLCKKTERGEKEKIVEEARMIGEQK